MIWALRWSVALRTFYRQILSLLYSSFPFGNFRPRLVRALLVYRPHQHLQVAWYVQLFAAMMKPTAGIDVQRIQWFSWLKRNEWEPPTWIATESHSIALNTHVSTSVCIPESVFCFFHQATGAGFNQCGNSQAVNLPWESETLW